MIFALLNQKGGVGKTTLAVHVAAALARRGRRIMLVDADPQGSALDWSANRQTEPLFPVIGLPRPNLHKEVPTHASQYEDVVIDGPPRVNELTRSALLAADMVLIVQRQLSCPVGDDCGGRLGGFTGDGRHSRRGLCDRRF